MIFRQLYEPSLGHASYLHGSEDTGEALVLDIRRDVGDYYDLARSRGLRIAYAADAHQHNDYLTGITQLESRAPLELLPGSHAELGYNTSPLQDRERLNMGEIEFATPHTPGQVPEHISLLVRDRSRGEDPVMLLSGGALLVADVARPDLPGDEAEKRENARSMCRTLRDKILPLPDHVLVFPTHVSGSLCGGNIGSMLMTTLGYERRLNDMLARIGNEDDFKQRCLDLGPLPTVPPYWKRMRKQNQDGPALLTALTEPPALQPKAFAQGITDGALVVDCRAPEAFAGAHIPGALNVGAGSSFPRWAGSILPHGADILPVVDAHRRDRNGLFIIDVRQPSGMSLQHRAHCTVDFAAINRGELHEIQIPSALVAVPPGKPPGKQPPIKPPGPGNPPVEPPKPGKPPVKPPGPGNPPVDPPNPGKPPVKPPGPETPPDEPPPMRAGTPGSRRAFKRRGAQPQPCPFVQGLDLSAIPSLASYPHRAIFQRLARSIPTLGREPHGWPSWRLMIGSQRAASDRGRTRLSI